MNVFRKSDYEVVDNLCVEKKDIIKLVKEVERGDREISELVPCLDATTGDPEFDCRFRNYYYGKVRHSDEHIRQLAIYYMNGTSPVPKNGNNGVELLTSLMYKDAIGTRILGDCMASGYGPQVKSQRSAISCYKWAAKNGDEIAAKKLKKLQKKMEAEASAKKKKKKSHQKALPTARYRNPRYEAARTVRLPGFKKHK